MIKAFLVFFPFLLLAQQPLENSVDFHVSAAVKLARRARASGDDRLYTVAEEPLAKALALEPKNFAARKTKVWLLIGQCEYAKALALATELNRQVPDDIPVYGLVADIQMYLGNYSAAETAAQWMLDLRPGNALGLLRGASLREVYGDFDGAIDFLRQAYVKVPPDDPEERALITTRIAHILTLKGDFSNADRAIANALKLVPDYHAALAALGKLREAQGNFDAAIEPLRKRNDAVQSPQSFFDLGLALSRAGRKAEANAALASFAAAARDGKANTELIFYYADFAEKPALALQLAEREATVRQDGGTLDALAWALYRNGKVSAARRAMERVLKLGVRDPDVLAHAQTIGAKLPSR